MISVHFQGKPFNIMVIQVYALTSNAEEAEVEQFYEDLQDILELTPKKDVLFIIGDWNAKVGSQETRGVTGKFGLGVQNKAGQRLIEFCQETVEKGSAKSRPPPKKRNALVYTFGNHTSHLFIFIFGERILHQTDIIKRFYLTLRCILF